MSLTTKEWVNFFKNAGIPTEESASYALIFTRNRIQKNMLVDLNKEYLKDMGISLLGDIIAILKHAQFVHERNNRASIFIESTETVQAIEKVDLTKKNSSSGSSKTVKRLLDHYTRKFNEAEVGLSAILPADLGKDKSSDVNRSESSHEKEHTHVAGGGLARRNADKDQGSSQPSESKHSSNIKKAISGKAMEKKTVFERLGDGTVSSTTPENKPRTSPIVAKSPSIFQRLGEVSSTSSVGEKNEQKIDVLPYAGVFKHMGGPSSGMGSSLKAGADTSRPKLKARLGATSAIVAARKDSVAKEGRMDFLKARELKMLKITTEFEKEDKAERDSSLDERVLPTTSCSSMALAGRKRKGGFDTEANTVSKSAQKKVRFGGTTQMLIPSGRPDATQKPSKLLKNFTNLKITAGSAEIEKGIKSRIGGKVNSGIPTHSKMVSDRMINKKPKMVSDTITRPSLKKTVKARIDLKSKKSIMDRLG